MGVHASPGADDGPGIEPDVADEQLIRLLDGHGADIVAGGHTHFVTDRVVGGIRALNRGSTGIPRTQGAATWILLEDDGDTVTVTHRKVPFDVHAVVRDLRRRRHPNTEFVTSILTGRRQQIRESPRRVG